jgi:hypothetical protein
MLMLNIFVNKVNSKMNNLMAVHKLHDSKRGGRGWVCLGVTPGDKD